MMMMMCYLPEGEVPGIDEELDLWIHVVMGCDMGPGLLHSINHLVVVVVVVVVDMMEGGGGWEEVMMGVILRVAAKAIGAA